MDSSDFLTPRLPSATTLNFAHHFRRGPLSTLMCVWHQMSWCVTETTKRSCLAKHLAHRLRCVRLACQPTSQQYCSLILNQHQPPATSQSAVLFFHNKSAPAISHSQANTVNMVKWGKSCRGVRCGCLVEKMADDVTSFDVYLILASNGIFLSKAPIIKQGIVWFRFLLVMMANYSHSSDYLIVELVWIDALNNIFPPKKKEKNVKY